MKRRQAFTIVELVIVIVVVGILAAITIVGYGSWRVRVAQTEVKNDLQNIIASMEDVRNRSDGYPVFTPGTQFNGTNSTKIVFTQSEHVTLTYHSGNTTTYCINAQSEEEPSVTMYVDIDFSLKPILGSC